MLSERILSKTVQFMNGHYMNMKPYRGAKLPAPNKRKTYMLYVHIPFCVRLCPYCSFNRFPFEEETARKYFKDLRKEIRMLSESGFSFQSMYVGGGTPTILPDELAETITLAKDLFPIKEVSAETNPDRLIGPVMDPLKGLIDRMSVGIQSFDDGLLKKMCRYEKYGSGQEIFERLKECASEGIFKTLNADMIYNYPGQTEEMLGFDLELIKESDCNQVTFYPLMASPAVKASIEKTMGDVNTKKEKRLYDVICKSLTLGPDPLFSLGSAWTFNRTDNALIDEYVVDYDEYVAAGSGGMSLLRRNYLVNTFSLERYSHRISKGMTSASSSVRFKPRDMMRYRFMMSLFGLRLDKNKWKAEFGRSLETSLPAEYSFLKLSGAFARDNKEEILLSQKGRYLLVAMMRQFFIGVNSVRDRARQEAGIKLVNDD